MCVSEAGSEREDLAAAAAAQPGRGRWRSLWGLRHRSGTSGILSGTNGPARRGFAYGLLAIAVLVGAFNFVNVTTVLHNRPQLDWIEPAIWEGSSWVTFLLFAVLPWAALQLAPFSVRPRWRLPLVHLPALVLFSVGHVVGFMLIRKGAYALAGAHYGPGLMTDFFYEFRKDILGYGLAVLAFWIAARQLPQPATAALGEWFDIRDGARLIRVPVASILAVTSAGNYVEFVLEDGRRPLMRSPLSALEAEFAPRGFVRIHRSWLVNAARVTALEPEGSGDYRVEMGEVAAPLSRRYRAALSALRNGG